MINGPSGIEGPSVHSLAHPHALGPLIVQGTLEVALVGLVILGGIAGVRWLYHKALGDR